jgi:6-phosphogluconate dehydrogenase
LPKREIGLIGLGKMGKNIAYNMLNNGYTVVAQNRSPAPLNEVASKGAIRASSIADLAKRLGAPRIVWVMLTAGDPTISAIKELSAHLQKGDIVIDGSNSNFKEAVMLDDLLRSKGILFLDAGCSGGPYGALHGMCTMVGGDKDAWELTKGIFKELSVENGSFYTGPIGSGHFVKMVHNAIEYGMMQSIAEGLELLEKGPYKELDLAGICNLWQNGSVVRSYLVELAGRALQKDKKLELVAPYVEDTGEGRWAIQTAIEHDVPFNVITTSLYERFHSRSKDHYSARVLAALRHEFGGHAVKEG